MSDKKCSDCMFKKRGECFGEEKTCNDFKPIPKVTDKEKENWPVVMRSSSQSVHMEWKKEQEKIANRSKINESPSIHVKKDINTETYTKLKNEIEKNEIIKTHKDFSSETHKTKNEQNTIINVPELYYDSITSISEKYADSIIIWIDNIETTGNKSYCRYLLEFKKQYLAGQGQPSIK